MQEHLCGKAIFVLQSNFMLEFIFTFSTLGIYLLAFFLSSALLQKKLKLMHWTDICLSIVVGSFFGYIYMLLFILGIWMFEGAKGIEDYIISIKAGWIPFGLSLILFLIIFPIDRYLLKKSRQSKDEGT